MTVVAGSWLQRFTAPVVTLDPGRQSASLGPTLGEEGEEGGWQRQRFTLGKHLRECVMELQRRRHTENGHNPAVVALKAKRREIALGLENSALSAHVDLP